MLEALSIGHCHKKMAAPLRIALIAPLAEAVPPRLYGGTERVVAHLADTLVALGQDVTLFASGDARNKARLVVVREHAIRLDPAKLKSDVAAHLAMLHEVRLRADEFDVLHFHVDLVDSPYHRQVIEPLLKNSTTEFLGEARDDGKNELLGGAVALHFPIDWPEPFGLVMIEAMACGTPVITWDEGAAREIVDEGITGFVVRSVDEAVDAVRRAAGLDRRAIREQFERRFSAITMSKNYLRLYSNLTHPASRFDEHDRRLKRQRSAAAHGTMRA